MLATISAMLTPQASTTPTSVVGLIIVTALLLLSLSGVSQPPSPPFPAHASRDGRTSHCVWRRYAASVTAMYMLFTLATPGPVVRLAPNEVSVIDGSAVKQMYKMGSKFWKSPWYLDFTGNPETKTLFATLNDVDHASHRRLVAHNFAEKTIRSIEPHVAKHTRTAVQGIEREMNTEGHTDVFKWFVFMANDIICQASFVENFGMLENGKKTDLYHNVLGISKSCMIRTQFPLVSDVLGALSPKRYGSVLRAITQLEQYSTKSLKKYQTHLEANPDAAEPTLLSKMFTTVADGALSFDQIRMEGVSYIIAGTETTAITATYAVWLLSRHPDHERKVREEVAGLPVDFTHDQLAGLPALCNSINEVLRLRTPVSQGLPRVTPPEGLRAGGYFVPGGTGIGAPAWSLHRDPAVWEEPEEFRPERWVDSTKEMRSSFVPWGGGSRICLGIHLAEMELRYVLAHFYRTFSAGVKPSPHDEFSEEEMETRSYFVILPKGKRCLMQSR